MRNHGKFKVRRSATICLFSKDDNEMMKAKTGNWFIDNPQRGRSNNSVVLLRDQITREEFAEIMKSVKDFGEPGFVFTDDLDFGFNPCVEIGLYPKTKDGQTGFQMCNLSEINGSQCVDMETYMRATKAAAILGTLQAGYTNFGYVSSATKEVTDREALLGVSITGWMNHPEFLFDEEVMKRGAENVKYWNKVVAEMIGINQSARTTCTKPSGNASVLLGTASGIHGEHSPRYFRNVQMNEMDDVLGLIEKSNPKMVEKSVWSTTGTDKVVSFPIESDPDSVYKNSLLGVKQLEYVKKAQQVWVESGTNVDLCVNSKLRHNISNTITVDDWDEVEQYIYDNRQYFAGISLLAASGDKAYAQAPFTEVFTAEQIFTKYGVGSMFASGLIVDGLHAFNNSLWTACDTLMGFGEKLDSENSADLLKRDWVRRASKFATNYFDGNVHTMTDCLKDCYNLHRWESISKSIKPVDFVGGLCKTKEIEIDTIGAMNCNGGQCEVNF